MCSPPASRLSFKSCVCVLEKKLTMLAALSNLRKENLPFHVHPQTIIVGTHHARKAFDPELAALIQTKYNTIVVDIHVLSSIRRATDWRYVAIVSSAAELYTIVREIRHNGKIDPVRFLIIGITHSLAEGVSIRLSALKELDAVGVILVEEESGRGRQIFQEVISLWGTNSEKDLSLSVWGDPSLSSKKDVIIPPQWDSEGKIRAVVDAAGGDYDTILEASTWGQEVLPPAVELNDEDTERQLEELAKRTKEEHLRKQDMWLKRMEELSTQVNQKPGEATGDVNGASEIERSPAQTDFFQKLLAGTR